MSKFLNNRPLLMISEQARIEKLNLISAFGTAAQLYEAEAGQWEKKRKSLYDAFTSEVIENEKIPSPLAVELEEEYKITAKREQQARENSAQLYLEAAEIAEELARGLK